MAVTLTPSVAAPRAKIDAIRVDVAGASPNDVADYDVDAYPTEAEIRCYLAFRLAGVEKGRSYVFSVGADGKHAFNNYIFPEAGAWTMRLARNDNDAVLKDQAITVS